MKSLHAYDIIYGNLPMGEHRFKFDVNQSFFDVFEFDQDFENPALRVDVILKKSNSLMNATIAIQGDLDLTCDITSQKYREEISNNLELVIKFGDSFDDSQEDIIVLLRDEHKLNLAQQIYELTLLALPIKRYHPDVAAGKIDDQIKKILDYTKREKKPNEIDPRWEALKKLKKDN